MSLRITAVQSKEEDMQPRVLLIMLVIAGLILAESADAHLTSLEDPDDTAATLDIRTASIGGEMPGDVELLRVTVRTYERFGRNDLSSGGFYVDFDSRAGEDADFTLNMGLWKDSSLHCFLSDRRGFSRAGGEAELGRRSYSCTFDRSVLNATRHLRWKVRSGSQGMTDSAPNRGWHRH
jgi:hypothetical protein